MKGKKANKKVVGLGIIAVAITLSIAGLPMISSGSEPTGMYFIYGHIYYNNTACPAGNVLVNITNTDRGETYFTTTDGTGWYSFNCGAGPSGGPGWNTGENLTITTYGNASQCWANWTGNTTGVVPDFHGAYYDITMETWLEPYDVGTVAINYPSDGASLCPTPISYIINATVENYGATYTHTFPVELYIYDSGSNVVFHDTKIVTLGPGNTTYVEFSPWAPDDATMDYNITVTTNMTCPNHDYMPWDDAKSINVHVDQRVINMQVSKTVWNETHWDERVDTVAGATVTFNISIFNNGVCSELTNISVTDTLSNALEYVPGTTYINGAAGPDPIIVGNTLTWNASMIGYDWPNKLSPGDAIYIVFNANVTGWGIGINNVSVDALALPTNQPITGEDAPGAWVITDNTPPVTTISYGNPNCVKDSTIYVTSATPITLHATDDITGVAYTKYWIDSGAEVTVYDNGVGDDNPNDGEITTTFYITGSDGLHTVHFYSVDTVPNVEATNSQEFYLDTTAPDISVATTGPRYGQYVKSNTTFALSASDSGSGRSPDVILSEDFESGVPPAGWEQHIYSGAGVWEPRTVDGTWKDPDGASGQYAIADSDTHSSDLFNVGLRTPSMDLTGYTNVTLTCGIAYENFAGWDYAEIRVLSNGGSNVEEVLAHWDYDVHQILFTATLDVANYSHPEDVQIEFLYNTQGYTYLWFFSVDNVEVTGVGGGAGGIPVNYRIWYNGTWSLWYNYTATGPFNLTGECKHIIQATAQDCLGNVAVENFTFMVDDTPPVVEKIITGPGMYNYTWITSETLFTLNSTDPEGGRGEGATTDVILSEDFEGAFPPSGWSVVGDSLWDRNDNWGRTNYAGGNGYCADADSDAYGSGGDTELWTPSFSLAGYSSAELTFIASYYDASWADDYADVDISTNGGTTWTNLLHWAEDHDDHGPGEEVTIDLTPYVGNSNVIVRWHYYAPGWDWYYEIDNVTITGVGGGALPCASGVNHTYYRIWYNGTWSDWIEYTAPFHLYNNCTHKIEFYAVDNLGNEGRHIVQTHNLDETLPHTWLTIDKDVWETNWGSYITPVTEFTIYASTEHGYNGTSGPYAIYFKITGPEGSKFYWQGDYYNCNGTWHQGYNNTPIAFQIRDENGYAPNGVYKVTSYAKNLLIDESGPQSVETFKIDTVAPESTLLFDGTYYAPADKSDTVYILPDTPMRWDANDNSAGVKLIKYRIDNGGWRIYDGEMISNGKEITIDEPGEHTLSYYAEDFIGNMQKMVTKTIVVDTTSPDSMVSFDGALLQKGSKNIITGETKVSFAANDESGIKAIYYTVDDGSKAEYIGPFTLPSGEHTITYYAVDNLGNEETAKHVTLLVDNKAPSINIEKPKTHYLYIAGRAVLPVPMSTIDTIVIGSMDIKASSSDESQVVAMELYVDGNRLAEINGDQLAWQWDSSSFSVHMIEIRAQDYFGHTNSAEIRALIINL